MARASARDKREIASGKASARDLAEALKRPAATKGKTKGARKIKKPR